MHQYSEECNKIVIGQAPISQKTFFFTKVSSFCFSYNLRNNLIYLHSRLNSNIKYEYIINIINTVLYYLYGSFLRRIPLNNEDTCNI